MPEPLVILGGGAVTPVGFTAAQSCAAIRAAITGFGKSGFFERRMPKPSIIGAPVPYDVGPAFEAATARLVRMATDALAECLRSAGLDPARTALLLGTKEPAREPPTENVFGHDPGGSTVGLLAAVQGAMGVRFHAASRAVPDGNCAAARGLLLARSILAHGGVDACVVGGVDSYLDTFDLDRLQRSFRLKREGVPNGVIPGEGAAFVAVTSRGRAASLRLPSAAMFGPARTPTQVPGSAFGRGPSLEILGVGIATEAAGVTVLGDGHATGQALRRAIEAAAQDAGAAEASIGFRVSDVNGESHGAFDSILAAQRFYRTRRERLATIYPAASVGETGAAAGAIGLLVAVAAMAKGYAPGNVAMCETSSEAGMRAACLLGAAGETNGGTP